MERDGDLTLESRQLNGGGARVAPGEGTSHPERFDPTQSSGTLMDSDHRGRYHWAAQLAGECSVLDAACGTGYGTEILAGAGAWKVTGVDLDEGAVAGARQRYAGDGVEFVQGDLTALELPDASFDLAVCFETIEHLEDPAAGLAELRRVVRAGGTLVVSSPNPVAYPQGNPHHLHELTPSELLELAGRHFGNVALHLQYARLASVIESAEPGGGARFHRAAQRGPGEPTFGIVVASDEDLQVMDALLTLGDPFEVRWWEEEVARGQARGEEASRESDGEDRIAELEARLLEQDREAAHALRSAGERERQLQIQFKDTGAALLEANQELAEAPLLKHRLAELYRENAELETFRHTLLTSRSWRWTRSLRSVGALFK